jgi:hypothetical protein
VCRWLAHARAQAHSCAGTGPHGQRCPPPGSQRHTHAGVAGRTCRQDLECRIIVRFEVRCCLWAAFEWVSCPAVRATDAQPGKQPEVSRAAAADVVAGADAATQAKLRCGVGVVGGRGTHAAATNAQQSEQSLRQQPAVHAGAHATHRHTALREPPHTAPRSKSSACRCRASGRAPHRCPWQLAPAAGWLSAPPSLRAEEWRPPCALLRQWWCAVNTTGRQQRQL